jgi:DNA polymerase-3 subunit alpha
MSGADFCHLHVHTQYSLLDGACRIEPMARMAAEMGMPAVAITDHGNMFGVVEFYGTMRKHGVKPLIGYEGYFTLGDRHTRERVTGGPELYHLTFLAADEAGYRNLVRMSSLAYLEGFYYKPRIDWDLLESCASGVVCLSGCLNSRLNQLLLAGARTEAVKWLGEMRELFGPERFYVELQNHGLPEQRQVLGPTLELARKLGIELVAANDCHFLAAEDRTWHDVLLCINTHSTLGDRDRFRLATDQVYFRSPAEMAQAFADVPEAIRNTLRIAEMCHVELDLSRKYPAFRQEGVPPEENARLLRTLATNRLLERYRELSPEMRQRLDYELSVIEEMGYVDYFLIVYDFVRFAREEAIPVGLRGSGAGSLVAHALDLTDINPMDYDLIFNRFMDPERKEPPDIDIDLCEVRREEVIDYVRRRYGPESTAQIISFGTLKARNCVRDVGRVLGVDLKKVDRVAKMIPQGPKVTLDGALQESAELSALVREDEEVARIVEFARRIEGLPRHASTHAAGVVMADKPLWEMVPLYKAGEGEVMTQWSMDDLAAVGMLKMDFLGLRTLTIIDRALRIIRDSGRRPPELGVDKLDLRDAKTYDFISRGLTRGVFQLGSSGMQRLLRRLQPTCIEDLIAAVALYRPGPLQSGMVDDFINRRHGHQEIVYPHPAFEPILKPTYGVLVYQEQIMRIVNTIAGMSMANALTMIKAISKKDEAIIERYHQDFVQGAMANGVEERTAEEIFGLIRHFAGYGFNKAHASAYAFVAFTTAYLKAHYPTEFMAASISCEMGNTDEVVALMAECRELGIEVLPPDINESRADFTPIAEGRLRFGLGAVKNAGEKAIECVIAAREAGGPFRNLFEFCERVDAHEVTRGAVEALMKAGCFDGLPGERAQQLAIVETAVKVGARARKDRQTGQRTLFGAIGEQDPEKRMAANLPDVPPLGPQELAAQEKEALGLYVRYDPLAEHRARLGRFCTAFSDQLESLPEGTEVVMGGMVENVRRRTTRSNDPMAVLQVLDTRDSFECVLFPRAYAQYGDVAQANSVLFFAGKVSHARGTSLQADEVLPFDKAQGRLAEAVFISVACGEANASLWAGLRETLARNSGQVPVFVDLVEEGFRLRTRVGNGAGVSASEHLAEELEQLVGAGRVMFGMRRSAPARSRPLRARPDVSTSSPRRGAEAYEDPGH